MLVVSEACTWGDAVLEELEKAAREERKSLWADPQPEPPWSGERSRRKVTVAELVKR